MSRQRQKLVADFGVTMHIAWARHMLDNREFVVGGGAQPGTEPVRVGGLDGSAAAEERDNYHPQKTARGVTPQPRGGSERQLAWRHGGNTADAAGAPSQLRSDFAP